MLKLNWQMSWGSADATTRALKPLLGPSVVRAWVLAALDADSVQSATLGLRWVDEAEGRALNLSYRAKDYATNVLTFDYANGPQLHADLVICTDVLVREALGQATGEAAANAHPWNAAAHQAITQHAAHLVVHGVLHAQGFDHERSAQEARTMENAEMLILHSLGFDNPYQWAETAARATHA
jgi:probable rRNA maturation factor